jgi:hypothetical protein
MTMRISVIGSCVTRDVWPIVGDLPNPFYFAARTSLVSMFFPCKIKVDYELLSFSTKWEKHCFQRDNEGLVLDELIAYQPDILILDFIDERYDLLKLGDGFLLKTDAFYTSNLYNIDCFKLAEVIARDSVRCKLLWDHSANKFCKFLNEYLPQTKVVLHRAPWASSMIIGDDLGDSNLQSAPETQGLYPNKTIRVSEYSTLTNEMYDSFESIMPGLNVIATDSKFHVCATEHQWKLAPFHYVRSYYHDFFKKIVALFP